MVRNIKLIISYDGSAYKGWQKTKIGPSIEEMLQLALEKVLQHPTSLQAASRTDSGVHAYAQVVNFCTPKEALNLNRLAFSLNQLLPGDISILSIEESKADFHPTLHSNKKEYHYWICNSTFQLPHLRHFSWHFPQTLDLDSMQKAAKEFIGTYDFASFCNQRKNMTYSNYERTIYHFSVERYHDQRLKISISGNNFLYKMVRNLVGTLVYIGCGKIALSYIPRLLAEKDRTLIGVTAPAHGLYLYKVYY